jgi:hypothetical protein
MLRPWVERRGGWRRLGREASPVGVCQLCSGNVQSKRKSSPIPRRRSGPVQVSSPARRPTARVADDSAAAALSTSDPRGSLARQSRVPAPAPTGHANAERATSAFACLRHSRPLSGARSRRTRGGILRSFGRSALVRPPSAHDERCRRCRESRLRPRSARLAHDPSHPTTLPEPVC